MAVERASWLSVLSLWLLSSSSHPGGQLRWHVDHYLASSDELLGEQRAGPGRALDGPPPRHEPGRPAQQPLSLLAVSRQLQHRLHPLIAVEHRGGVRAAVRVDPDHIHDVPPHRGWCATAGRPDEVVMPILLRATP